MLSNTRLQSRNITKFTSNEKAYDLWHSSIASYPHQFKSYLTDHLKMSIDESKIKRITFSDFKNDYDFYPDVHLGTFSAIPTKGFLDLTTQAFSTKTTFEDFNDLYPIAVRWTNNKDLWLIERPPFQATVTFKNSRSNGTTQKVHTFNIWVPWTLMFLQSEPQKSSYNAWLYFNDGPLNSIDDNFIPCFYPNMYNDARMCLNQTVVLLQQHLAELNKFDIKTIYNFIINDYMSGGWNLDLGISIFELIAAKGQSSIKSAYEKITDGYTNHRANKKVLSFLKHFSTLDLNQVMTLVSEAKKMYPISVSIFDNFKFPSSHRMNHPSDYLANDYFYSDNYAESAIMNNTTYYPLLRQYALIIEATYANDLSFDNIIRKYRYASPDHSKEVKAAYDEFNHNAEEYSNRMLDFFESYHSNELLDLANPYIDYKNYKENPFILVTKDSIDVITPDMPTEYFTSKLTSQVFQNV